MFISSVDQDFVEAGFSQQLAIQRLVLRIDVEIYQTVKLKETVKPHKCAHIPRKMASDCGSCQVNLGSHLVKRNHEVSVLLISLRCFRGVVALEEFR